MAKNQHKCGYTKCFICKKYTTFDHQCYMQPYKFLDEIAFEKAGCDEDALKKAEALYRERERKSRYVVWDIETFVLDQASDKGRLVPHFLSAATVCYKCLNKPFVKQTCTNCSGLHNSHSCMSQEPWLLDNSTCKISTWATDHDDVCDECHQEQIVIRAGCEKDLFKHFIDWLLRDCMYGFTLVAHNGASFDSPYLFRQIYLNYGLHIVPTYSGSKLLEFKVKKVTKINKIFIAWHRQCSILPVSVEKAS
jgi:hypothetical protein